MSIDGNERDAGRPRRGTAGRLARLLTSLPLGALLVLACEGDSLFSEGATDLQPRLLNLSVPDPVAGQQVQIRVEASAVRGVSQIVLALRGAVSKDTVVDINPPSPNVSQVIAVDIPLAPAENELVVQARVIDALGKTSRVLEVVAIVTSALPPLAFDAAPFVAGPRAAFVATTGPPAGFADATGRNAVWTRGASPGI